METEPPVKVACDFDRVGDILEELKRQGVDKAEICLVGWNVKGHDGRWPQAFPVCEELGGEEKLRALIQKAQKMGYQITCHTNSTDQYEIADCYDAENTRVLRNGKPAINAATNELTMALTPLQMRNIRAAMARINPKIFITPPPHPINRRSSAFTFSSVS